jgi:hypothetical protein
MIFSLRNPHQPYVLTILPRFQIKGLEIKYKLNVVEIEKLNI